MSPIKVLGNVGEVNAPGEPAGAACARGRGVFSIKVMQNPAEGIEKLIYNSQTVGYVPAEEKTNDESVEEETTDSTEE